MAEGPAPRSTTAVQPAYQPLDDEEYDSPPPPPPPLPPGARVDYDSFDDSPPPPPQPLPRYRERRAGSREGGSQHMRHREGGSRPHGRQRTDSGSHHSENTSTGRVLSAMSAHCRTGQQPRAKTPLSAPMEELQDWVKNKFHSKLDGGNMFSPETKARGHELWEELRPRAGWHESAHC